MQVDRHHIAGLTGLSALAKRFPWRDKLKITFLLAFLTIGRYETSVLFLELNRAH
jgi:hypothetical protein